MFRGTGYIMYEGGGMMDPVVGLDVAKGESQGQAFVDKGQPYGKSFQFRHTVEGLEEFLSLLKEIEEHTDRRPVVVLEATGHYHAPVVHYLEEHQTA